MGTIGFHFHKVINWQRNLWCSKSGYRWPLRRTGKPVLGAVGEGERGPWRAVSVPVSASVMVIGMHFGLNEDKLPLAEASPLLCACDVSQSTMFVFVFQQECSSRVTNISWSSDVGVSGVRCKGLPQGTGRLSPVAFSPNLPNAVRRSNDLSLLLVNMVSGYFQILTQPYTSSTNPTWLGYVILFLCCWIEFSHT